ncbi:alpha/beta hydrolase [Jannaschia pohangensis]|uniref:Alpha/beta hydrolase family protein n=1 Tax=Jannaschia pohangensis TaxID=390807 RepID=A0A1I3GSS5_9RHOB|nr:alpha/beta fold hydrolase [Jannaschia pohangensis]SFI26362.1 Alpha/beta hydrolase family protein [Jannaschia pohangensis]
MAQVIRGLLFLVIGLFVAGAALWIVGPYEPVDRTIDFDPSTVPDDVDGWLADREGRVSDLRPDAAKYIDWAGVPGTRTDIAIVYVHGFSATLWEIRPVPERVGEALGANVYFTRLTGHGRTGDAMAEATAGDWIEDLAEAVAVGRKLGNRVVIMGTSTGATLAALLAADPALADLKRDVAGMILISPNFRVANPAARLLSMPAARYWAGLVAGERRSFQPVNQRHGENWQTEYPTVALLPMQAMIDHSATLDWADADIPALFWFSPDDSVVDHSATEAVAAAWGGPVTVERIAVPEGDDPYDHVIAGDILSPNGTPAAIAAMTDWIRGL